MPIVVFADVNQTKFLRAVDPGPQRRCVRISSPEESAHAGQSERLRVGPGRPPLHSRFKKGQSGNPGGRRAKTLPALLAAALDEEVYVTTNGRRRKITKREVTQEGYCQVLVSGSRVTPQPSTPAPNKLQWNAVDTP